MFTKTGTIFAVVVVLLSQHGVDAVSWNCFKPPKPDYEITDYVVDVHVTFANEDLMTEAFNFIDEKLRAQVRAEDPEPNFKALRKMFKAELEAKDSTKSGKACRMLKRADSSSCSSELSEFIHRDIMINALARLLLLERVYNANTTPDNLLVRAVRSASCDISLERILAMNNRIAMNPIERRVNNGKKQFPRIDNLIFDLTFAKAQLCLPVYRDQLVMQTVLPNASDGFLWMYWDRVFEYRMRKAKYPSEAEMDFKNVKTVFERRRGDALDFVKRMPNAFEEDEVDIALKFFDFAGKSWYSLYELPEKLELRMSLFERYILEPCKDYTIRMRRIFEPADFYLKVKSFVTVQRDVERCETDPEMNRHRAYYLMCEKVIQRNEKDRFEKFLKYYEPADKQNHNQ